MNLKHAGAILAVFLALGIGLEAGYKIGWHERQRIDKAEERAYLMRKAYDLSEEMIDGMREVSREREQSMYDKGLQACLHRTR